MAGTDRLMELVHDLLQELFDYIYDLTIRVDGDVRIDDSYRPPIGLHFSRKIRSTFACNYYHTRTFHSTSTKHISKCLLSLPRDHIFFLRDVQWDCDGERGWKDVRSTQDIETNIQGMITAWRAKDIYDFAFLTPRLCEWKDGRLVPKDGGQSLVNGSAREGEESR